MDAGENIDIYPCSKCGACCRRINIAVQYYKSHIEKDFQFPYGWNSQGVCENLTGDNKCAVYEERPDICNIDKMVDSLNISKQDFYQQNMEVCNRMIREDNLDLSFLLKN